MDSARLKQNAEEWKEKEVVVSQTFVTTALHARTCGCGEKKKKQDSSATEPSFLIYGDASHLTVEGETLHVPRDPNSSNRLGYFGECFHIIVECCECGMHTFHVHNFAPWHTMSLKRWTRNCRFYWDDEILIEQRTLENVRMVKYEGWMMDGIFPVRTTYELVTSLNAKRSAPVFPDFFDLWFNFFFADKGSFLTRFRSLIATVVEDRQGERQQIVDEHACYRAAIERAIKDIQGIKKTIRTPQLQHIREELEAALTGQAIDATKVPAELLVDNSSKGKKAPIEIVGGSLVP
jgi:hypothetical protein